MAQYETLGHYYDALVGDDHACDQWVDWIESLPGWQSRARHMASSVEKRTALTLPVLIRDKLTGDNPMRSASSLPLTLRSASMRSNRSTIMRTPSIYRSSSS